MHDLYSGASSLSNRGLRELLQITHIKVEFLGQTMWLSILLYTTKLLSTETVPIFSSIVSETSYFSPHSYP